MLYLPLEQSEDNCPAKVSLTIFLSSLSQLILSLKCTEYLNCSIQFLILCLWLTSDIVNYWYQITKIIKKYFLLTDHLVNKILNNSEGIMYSHSSFKTVITNTIWINSEKQILMINFIWIVIIDENEPYFSLFSFI